MVGAEQESVSLSAEGRHPGPRPITGHRASSREDGVSSEEERNKSKCITYNHGRPLSLKGKLSQRHSKNLVPVACGGSTGQSSESRRSRLLCLANRAEHRGSSSSSHCARLLFFILFFIFFAGLLILQSDIHFIFEKANLRKSSPGCSLRLYSVSLIWSLFWFLITFLC